MAKKIVAEFRVNSSQVRYEPRLYWLEELQPDGTWKAIERSETRSKQTAQRRFNKLYLLEVWAKQIIIKRRSKKK